MEDDIGSKIVTIAIMLNGNIIETNLAPTKQDIFDVVKAALEHVGATRNCAASASGVQWQRW